jgi:hypothetical protein
VIPNFQVINILYFKKCFDNSENETNEKWKHIPGNYAISDSFRYYLHWLTVNRGNLRYYGEYLGIAFETLRRIWKFVTKKVRFTTRKIFMNQSKKFIQYFRRPTFTGIGSFLKQSQTV